MNRSAAPTARVQDEPADIGEGDEDADSPARPIHDVSCVLNYPSKLTCSGE